MVAKRVLLEHPNALALLDLSEALAARGIGVSTCAGPSQQPGGTCPLVSGSGCYLAENADVIVNLLGSRDQAVYLAQRLLLPETPTCLGMSEDDPIGDVVADIRAVPEMIGGEELAAEVARLLATD